MNSDMPAFQSRRYRTSQGFTLLEVMIALMVFVSVAVTITDTTGLRVSSLFSMKDQTLAAFVAENRIAEIRLSGIVPPEGEAKSTTEMANREWRLLTKSEKTQFGEMRRITVEVSDNETPDRVLYTLATVMGTH